MRKLMFFLVSAAVAVGGVVAIGSVSAAPVRAGLPKLQLGPSCDAAARGSVILGRNKEACLADETTAQDTLKQNWPKYLATDKIDCVTLENSGGPASYVELLSCLEIMRDARSIRNADRSIATPHPSTRAVASASKEGCPLGRRAMPQLAGAVLSVPFRQRPFYCSDGLL